MREPGRGERLPEKSTADAPDDVQNSRVVRSCSVVVATNSAFGLANPATGVTIRAYQSCKMEIPVRKRILYV